MTSLPDAAWVAGLLKAVANPVRWRILRRLAQGPCVVGVLVEAGGESQSSVSQHLQKLRARGLVSCMPHATWREYRLSPGLAEFIRATDQASLDLTRQG